MSKTLISTATYIPVPLAVLVMAFLKPLTSPVPIFIPFFIILAITSACIFEIKLFLSSSKKGKKAALVDDSKKLIAGAMIIMIPEIAYVMSYLIVYDHILAILVLGAVALSELLLAVYQLKR